MKVFVQELTIKMKEAENDSHEGKRKVESLWPVFKIHHQRSRYIFDLFYKRKAISVSKKRVNILLRKYVILRLDQTLKFQTT